MLAVAATGVLAIVAGTIVAALLLSGGRPPSRVGESTTSAAASPTATQNPSGLEPSPPGSVIPYAADAPLLQVSVAGLRMRAEASTDAEVIRTFDVGEVVRVQSGPVEADGFAWSEVMDLDSRSGWAAMGGGAAPWLEPVPPDPATSELLLRLGRACDADEHLGSPVFPADVALSADGRVVLISGAVRQLSASGLARIQQDVLQMPALQVSASYKLDRRPDVPVGPGHGACANRFTLGEGARRVVIDAVSWQGDAEEATYFLPSPERRALDELAIHLQNVEAWLGPAAWSDPVARRYVSSSYQFWLDRLGETPPPDLDAPSVTGVPWPFEGAIEQFGQPVGRSRCGYLDLGQAFETLRLLRVQGVDVQAIYVDPPRRLSLDGFGSGSFTTDAGWFTFYLTPRSPDGFPACPD